MKTKILLIVLALMTGAGIGLRAAPMGTSFTYQGRLNTSNGVAQAGYDFHFSLFDASSGGNLLGSTLTLPGVAVSNGVFTVTLDFGAGVFAGDARWLEIELRPGGSLGNFALLLPRQPVSPAPHALYAGNAGTASVATTANGVSANSVTTANLQNSSVTAAKIASGQVVKSLNGLTDAVSLIAGANVSIVQNGNALQIAATGGGSGGWGLTGNGGTTPGVNFLGTTDNQPVELRSSGVRALSLEYASRSSGGLLQQNTWGVNVLGGLDVNSIDNGVVGATIAGGGSGNGNLLFPNYLGNSVGSDFGTVGGGAGNRVNGSYATIPGGKENGTATDFSVIGGGKGNSINNSSLLGNTPGGTIGGGEENTIRSGSWNTIGGGKGNRAGSAEPGSQYSYVTVGGGLVNVAEGDYSTVPGGYYNWAPGAFSLAAGRQAKAVHAGAFVWADSQTADFYSIADNEFAIRAAGGVRVVGSLTTQVLTITGGADVAEPFHVSGANVAKGSVVVIDDAHPGQLKLSDRAYDTRVAGVVSGANGIRPGLSLHQDGAVEGGENVALSGRVYVLAEATQVPIRPGDLLTTSETPGHTMKVQDTTRAQGAVLGKAMSSLGTGRGLVLILVTLQ